MLNLLALLLPSRVYTPDLKARRRGVGVVGRRDDALRRREERGGAAGEKHDQKEAGHFVESDAVRAVLRRV